jgi:alkyl hydroperoxide reductase subunit AhpC
LKPILKILLLLIILIQTVSAAPSKRLDLPQQLQNGKLPSFVAKDPRGLIKNFQLKRMVEEGRTRVALVYFATWCMPCRDGMLRLREQADSLTKNGVQVVLVNVGEENQSAVHKWVAEYSNPEWPLILDTRGQMVLQFGLAPNLSKVALPMTLVLDGELVPQFLLGTEGDDWPGVLWENEL